MAAGRRGSNRVTDERPPLDPLALAMEWVAKITTVALEMVLPAVGGGYLDRRFGTNYWALAGVAVGMVVGMWHLLQMTRPKGGDKGNRSGA
jgi:Putative F0F1-ATPase subunit Ca2+/Mg2+ transporter